jgi:5-(carboxyamino)imidazole ribonucleotide mutase
MSDAIVSIIMGSDSDLGVMQSAADILQKFDIAFELKIVSAHRTPDRMMDFARKAHSRGIRVIIAGAGGAAHLPGMVASLSPLPVIGVPVKSRNSIDGWDSMLSILQMPNGVPVATVAVDAATNAAPHHCGRKGAQPGKQISVGSILNTLDQVELYSAI